jgi:hypothetical protein
MPCAPAGELTVLTRYRRVPKPADECSRMLEPDPAREQGLWLSAERPKTWPDFDGKEGVAGSSPAEGS